MSLKQRLDDEKMGREAKLKNAIDNSNMKKDKEFISREEQRNIREQNQIQQMMKDKERFAKEAYMKGRQDERPKANMNNINSELIVPDEQMIKDGEPTVEQLNQMVQDEERLRQEEMNRNLNNSETPPINELDAIRNETQMLQDQNRSFTPEELKQAEMEAFLARNGGGVNNGTIIPNGTGSLGVSPQVLNAVQNQKIQSGPKEPDPRIVEYAKSLLVDK